MGDNSFVASLHMLLLQRVIMDPPLIHPPSDPSVEMTLEIKRFRNGCGSVPR